VTSTSVALRVNGTVHDLCIEPRVTLLEALREHIGLTGSKRGCGRGQCGACTVLVNGRRINSCLSLAIMHVGDEITTIEGLARADGSLHPLQAAFLDHDAFQCGFCTPGQICSAVALVEEHRSGAASHEPLTDAAVREQMSGNLCRCGAYPHIVAAILEVARA
jgi:xanthine dehydrogenase YagT iron-sulfur-binding subunit